MSLDPEQRSIGVVVPAYNTGTMLHDALEAIRGQTIEPARVVVVDDGSSDDTRDVALAWCGRLPLEVVALSENQGPANARNHGVARLDTDLVAFMDSDDVWAPRHLEVCVALQRECGGAAIARSCFLHGDGTVSTVSVADPPRPDEQLGWIIRRNTLGMHAVLPRRVVDAVGGFDPSLDGAEDWDFWIRVARSGTILRRPSHWTYFKRQHPDNLSKRTEFIARASLRMLDRLADDLSPEDRRRLGPALREARAGVALFRAFGQLRAGDRRWARRLARQSLSGPPEISARGAVIAVSPRAWEGLARLRAHVNRLTGSGSGPGRR